MAFFGALGEFAIGEVESTSDDVDVSASVSALTLTALPASVALNVEVNASSDALTVIEHQSIVSLGFLTQASTATLTLNSLTASISLDVDVRSARQEISLNTYRSDIDGGNIEGVVDAASVTLVLRAYASVVDVDYRITDSPVHADLITGRGFQYTLDDTITAGR